MSDSEKPLPCPFCGTLPQFGINLYVPNSVRLFCGEPWGGCGMANQDAYQTKAEAVAAWNRRAVPPELADVLAKYDAWVAAAPNHDEEQRCDLLQAVDKLRDRYPVPAGDRYAGAGERGGVS